MIVTTTDSVPGRETVEVLGLVAGEAVLGSNIFRDFFASIRDVIGGRSGAYQDILRKGRYAATDDMIDEARRLGADAIVGVDMDYEALGDTNTILMVSINGTAVKLR